jgi:putative ABC transport system permease protein
MKFLLLMAWRELRAARRRSLFFLFSIAIGVAGLVGVKGFSNSLHGALLDEARPLLAADMRVRQSFPANAEQQDLLDRLRTRGIGISFIREAVSMAYAPSTGETALVELKAVQPDIYPFYGKLTLVPDGLPGPGSVFVAPELLDRLRLAVGGSIRLGQETYTVAGIVEHEPDRVSGGFFSLGPRVLMHQAGLDRSGLIGPGARVQYTWGLKLGPQHDVEALRQELEQAFEPTGGRVADFRQANPSIARRLDNMTRFLSMVGMVALLVGGLGVANVTRVFVHQKMDSIAIMKCLGAPSRTIFGIYLTQMLILGLLGSVAGILVGYGVQLVLPPMLRPIIGLEAALTPTAGAAMHGIILGLSTALLFTLLPLAAVRDVRPALVFRRDVDTGRRRWSPLQLLLLAVATAGVTAIATWQAGSLMTGIYFTGGLAAAVLVLGAAAWGATSLVRRLPIPSRLTALRHGLGNLHRPGSQTTAVVLALGIGVTVVLGVYLVQANMIREVQASSPEGSPNLFFLGITEREADRFREWLPRQEGVVNAQDPLPVYRGRIAGLDGVPVEQARLDNEGRDWTRWSYSLTWAAEMPPGNELRAGRWWAPADYAEGQVLASVQKEAAERLRLRLGSTVTMEIDGVDVTFTVFNLRETVEYRQGAGFNFVLNPGALDEFTATYVGMARVDPAAVVAIQRAAVVQFPGVTVINLGDVLTSMQKILDRIALVIRFMAGFAVLAGLIILAGSIAATKFRRMREAALLKTLGATRGGVLRIFALEYLSLGLVAGLFGSVLASVAAWLVMRHGLDIPFRFHAVPLAAGMAATAVLTVLTGLLFTWEILSSRPLEVLRNE